MKALPQNNFESPAPSGALRCTLLYDDFDCGLRARNFAESLARRFEPTGQELVLWRLDLLSLPEVHQAALKDATASDFVIISLRGDDILSDVACSWLAAWLRTVDASATDLIALFDPNHSVADHMHGTRTTLRIAAAGAGVAFFACCASRDDEPSGTSASNGSVVIEERVPRRRIASDCGPRQRPAFV